MRKKLLSILLATTMVCALCTGCGNKNNTKESTSTEVTSAGEKLDVVYENEYVKVAQYKGLSTTISEEEIKASVTDDVINSYVEALVNNYYNSDRVETTEETTEAAETTQEATTEAVSEDTDASAETTETTEAPESKVVTYTIDQITDDMVNKASTGEYTTVVAYKEHVKEVLEATAIEDAQANVQYTLFDNVLQSSELINYEEDVYQLYYNYSNEYYKEYATYMGVEWNDFIVQYLGLTDEAAYEELLKEEATSNTKSHYVIIAIAENEKIEATDADVDAEIQKYIDEGGFESEDAVLEYISRDEIKLNVLYYDILDIILENATIEDTPTAQAATTEATTTETAQ